MSTNSNISTQGESSFSNVVCFVYSLLCYGATLLSLASLIVFVSGVCPQLDVNKVAGETSAGWALLINLGLVSLFGIQHSVMARKGFKNWLKRYVNASVERATYCLASAAVILFMVFFWQPMAGEFWSLDAPYAIAMVRVLGVLGWLLLLAATFQLNHFELFGLQQTYAQLRRQPIAAQQFKTPGLYRVVRHPIQLGALIGVWAVPVATLGHFVFAASITAYIFIGLYFEEKDLIAEFGEGYREYKRRVAKLIPFLAITARERAVD